MKLKPRTARLIAMSDESPAMNMAIDQAILELVDRDRIPTLRLYGWREPTLSLGYFQSITDREQHSPSQSLSIVRRATGGGAIIHHHELTYSFVWPLDKSSTGARSNLYRRTHQAIIETLTDFGVTASRFADQAPAAFAHVTRLAVAELSASSATGWAKGTIEPFLCFQRRTAEDLIINGYKVVGSAQRTARGAVLQHGSVLLNVSPHAAELPGLNDLLGQQLSAHNVGVRFAERMAERFGIHFEPYQLEDDAKNAAKVIANARFASDRWTQKR